MQTITCEVNEAERTVCLKVPLSDALAYAHALEEGQSCMSYAEQNYPMKPSDVEEMNRDYNLLEALETALRGAVAS